jgi:hypothetical protein
MKTAVIMKRELFGMPVSQHSKTEFFSSTDLVKAGNKWRAINGLSQFNEKAWLNNKSTQEFIEELELKYGKVRIPARGRGQHTWLHPLLFIDMALAISPKLKIETYEWMFDQLIKNRNDSGDSYNLMSGALYNRQKNKSNFPRYITDVARNIRNLCKVTDWQEANQSQLKMRDDVQREIALLCEVLNDPDLAIRIAFSRAIGIEENIPKLVEKK